MDLNNLAKQLSKYKLSMVDVPEPLAFLIRPLDQDAKDFLFQLVWVEKNKPAQEVYDWKLENDLNMDRLFDMAVDNIEQYVKHDPDADLTNTALQYTLKNLPTDKQKEFGDRLVQHAILYHKEHFG